MQVPMFYITANKLTAMATETIDKYVKQWWALIFASILLNLTNFGHKLVQDLPLFSLNICRISNTITFLILYTSNVSCFSFISNFLLVSSVLLTLKKQFLVSLIFLYSLHVSILISLSMAILFSYKIYFTWY